MRHIQEPHYQLSESLLRENDLIMNRVEIITANFQLNLKIRSNPFTGAQDHHDCPMKGLIIIHW